MNRYTIYCTEEQVRQVIELGAPIKLFCKDYMYGHINYMGSPIPIGHVWIHNDLYYTPTAEQMIGWLNDKGLLVSIGRNCGDYCWQVWERSLIVDMSETETISTIKEATLAAIDAALEYLENLKQ